MTTYGRRINSLQGEKLMFFDTTMVHKHKITENEIAK